MKKQETNKDDNEVKIKLILKKKELIRFFGYWNYYVNSGQYYNLARVKNIRVNPGQNPSQGNLWTDPAA